MPDELITPAEAARILGTSPVRVARMIRRGELASVRRRRTVTDHLLRRAEVESLAPLPPGRDGRPRVVRSVERADVRHENA